MRKLIAIIGAFALAMGLAVVGAATPVLALSPGVDFGANTLSTWQTNGVVWAVASAHGRVVAGGTFTQLSPPSGGSGTAIAVNSLAVLDADTGAPTSCQYTMALAGGSPAVFAATTSPDGNLVYIGGNFSNINGTSVTRLAALNPVTCSVSALRVSSISAQVRAIAVSPDGNTIYIGGDFQSVAGQPRLRFAAVNASNGALLPWVADVAGTDAGAPANGDADGLIVVGRAIAVSPNGDKVAIGGHFYTVNGQDSHALAVVDATTGANVQNYPDGFIPHTSVIHALATDGGDFYAGAQGTGGGVFDGAIKIDWSSLQQVWRDTCLGAIQAILPYDGTLYELHHHHDCSSMNEFPDGKRYHLTANSEADASLLGWSPNTNDGIGEQIGPRALTVAQGTTTGATLWIGGEFTTVNGQAQEGLTRFPSTDNYSTPVPSPVAVQAMSTGGIQVRFRTVVDLDDTDVTYAVYRNGASSPIWTGTGSSMWWTRPQVTFVDTNVVPGTTYSYRVSASDGTHTSALSASVSAKAIAAQTDYSSQVIADGAQLYWRYDETSGTWLQDKSGATTSGLNGLYEQGAIGGSPGAIPGDPSTAATFNGSNQYAWSDQLKPAPSTYSVETWIKTATSSGGMIIGYGNGQPSTLDTRTYHASSSYDRHLYMDNSGHLIFGVWVGGAQLVQTPKSYNDGQWHYVVATQGPSGIVMYVDGVRIGTNPTTTAQDYYGSWRVGGDNLNGWPNKPDSNFFAGTIDETAVYPAPLSAQQVANHYTLAGGVPNVNHAPSDAYGKAVFNDNPDLYWRLAETSGSAAADSSFNGQNQGVYGNRVQQGQTGISGSGIQVTGSQNSTVGEASPVASPGAFSQELWFMTGSNSGGKLIGFENTQSGDGNNYDKQVYMTSTGSLIFGVYNGQVDALQSNAGYNDNKWHQVVATQDSSGMKLYLDGALITSNNVATNQSYSGYWRIGGGNLNGWPQQPPSNYFSGSLDEAAVYSTALSSADVASHYALGVNDSQPPTAPTSVDATATGGSVQVSWTGATDNIAVVGYRVYRGTTSDFTPAVANKVADVTATTWEDDAPLVGTSYYKVIAVDGAGNVSPASAAAPVTVADVTPPTAPTGLTATATGTSAALSWTAATDNVGVTGYTVYRGTTSDFTADASSRIADATGTSFTDSGLATGAYYYKVTAVDAAGNVSDASSSAEADVDATSPSVPSGVSAVASGSSVAVTWDASTDNVGVTGYTVYRGADSGFVIGTSNKVADVTGTSYTDSGLAAGTYYYKVTARDGAGNVSGPSSAASATVAAVQTVVKVSPTQDAFVAASAPTTNYGTNTQLSANGTSGSQSYLKFVLPAAPDGTHLTGATLSVRTSTDPSAGSTDPHPLSLLNPASWDQSTVTWNTRPTGIGAQIGTLSGTTAINTPYSATLDVAQLQALLGTTVSFALTGTGTDNVRLFSQDIGTVAYRPILTLTYTAD